MQQTKILAGALMGALVVIAVVTYVVFNSREDVLALPPVWMVAAQVAAGLVVHALVEAVGYRAPALDPSIDRDEALRQAQASYQTLMVTRFALCESIAIASLAGAFILREGGWVGYVTGAAVSLTLMAAHVWPGSRPIDKVQTSLQRDGARVPLHEAFGLEPKLTGPIQEL
jgi:hypothetical protein